MFFTIFFPHSNTYICKVFNFICHHELQDELYYFLVKYMFSICCHFGRNFFLFRIFCLWKIVHHDNGYGYLYNAEMLELSRRKRVFYIEKNLVRLSELIFEVVVSVTSSSKQISCTHQRDYEVLKSE